MQRKTIYAVMFFTVFIIAGLYLISETRTIQVGKGYTENFAGKFKVMTFNIRGGRDDHNRLQVAGIVDEIKDQNPDIVGLQEVDVGMPRSGFVNEVDKISHELQMNYVFVPDINFVVGSYGDAILSKYPIKSYTHYRLPSGLESRGILKAQVPIGKETISIYTTHLGLSRSERAQQFADLEAIIRSDPAPKVVLGDFNTRPTDQSFIRFREFFADSRDAAKKPLITIPSEHTQIDYILHTNEFTALDIKMGHSAVSDHNPLLYTFSMKS